MIVFIPGVSDLIDIRIAFNTPQVILMHIEEQCPNNLRKGYTVLDFLVKKEVRIYYNL